MSKNEIILGILITASLVFAGYEARRPKPKPEPKPIFNGIEVTSDHQGGLDLWDKDNFGVGHITPEGALYIAPMGGLMLQKKCMITAVSRRPTHALLDCQKDAWLSTDLPDSLAVLYKTFDVTITLKEKP